MNEQPLALTDQLVRQQEEIEELTKERDDLRAAYENLTGVCLSLQKERNEAIARAESAESKCAETWNLLERTDKWFEKQSSMYRPNLAAHIEHALSANCGKPLLDRVKRLEDVVIELSKELQNEWEDVLRPFCNDATAQHARAVINRACAALGGAKQALETEATK